MVKYRFLLRKTILTQKDKIEQNRQYYILITLSFLTIKNNGGDYTRQGAYAAK